MAQSDGLQSSVKRKRSIGSSGATEQAYKGEDENGARKCAHMAEDLCEEQAQIVKLTLSGQNVFFTGGAGTGKSFVLRRLVRELRARGRRVEVVTPTGISAINVGGITYFTFAGWYPGTVKKSIKEIEDEAMGKVRRRRMAETEVLIIDEISMLEANQFRRLDRACRMAKWKREEAFSRVQVIVTGDFYQLPPVKAFQTCFECGTELRGSSGGTDELQCRKCAAMYNRRDRWAFRSESWTECRFESRNLTTTHRQKDPVFIDILNTLRTGRALSKEQVALLSVGRMPAEGAIELSAVKREVARKNRLGFEAIRGVVVRAYRCQDHADIKEHHPELAGKKAEDSAGNLVGCQDHRFPPILETKYGMPVILLSNIDPARGLVNGSQGRIVGYSGQKAAFAASWREKQRRGAWGVLEEAEIAAWAAKQGKDFQLPVVVFENRVKQVVMPECLEMEMGDPAPFSVVARTQLPILPAWAITIHKSQGMTLEKAVVNLQYIFERQMAYVALSRLKGLAGLTVVGISGLEGSGEEVEEVVREFMNKVETFPKS